jgi:hypothetical protein
MNALESLSVDQYYMTLNTYIRISEERNENAEKMGSDEGIGNSNRQITSLRK